MSPEPPARRVRPVYAHPPEKVGDRSLRRLLSLDVLEDVSFVLVTLGTLLFAVLVLRRCTPPAGWRPTPSP